MTSRFQPRALTYEEAMAELPRHLRQAVIDRLDIYARAASSDFRRYSEAVDLLRQAAKWMDERGDDHCPTCDGSGAHDEGCLRHAIQSAAWPKVTTA